MFLHDSVWNQPIPATTPYGVVAAATGVPVGLDSWSSGAPWSIPCYTASSRDPLRPVLFNPYAWSKVANGQWRRDHNGPAAEAEIMASSRPRFPYEGNVFSSVSASAWVLPNHFNRTRNPPAPPARFHIGPSMTPAPGADGHMAVSQSDGSVLETYGSIRLSDGTIVALSYSITNSLGEGDGGQNGQTASMIPACAGLLTDEEVASGRIDHAIAITVPGHLLQASAVYPALAFDRDAATNAQPYGGTIPMGSRLALQHSVDIASLGLRTPEGRAIAIAAETHGFIVVDRGGAGITLRVRRNAEHKLAALRRVNQGLKADLATIFRQIRRVPPPASSQRPQPLQ